MEPGSVPSRSVLVVATTNANKVREIEPILAPALAAAGLRLAPLDPAAPEVAEDRSTFAGNAAKKALAAAAWSHCVSLAEDSGLEVKALDGAPGVLSARFSGGGTAENNRLLLERLAGLPPERRAARFSTAAVLKAPGGALYAARGEASGRILTEPRGEGGFGYDPVFLSRDLGRTFAQAAPEEKRRVSHRSRALRALRGYLLEVPDGSRATPPRGTPSTRTPRAVPDHRACLEHLKRAGCPAGLVAHQLAVGRASREMALRLAEAGQTVDVLLASAAGLLHDVGRVFEITGRPAPVPIGEAPPGVTRHAFLSAAWARAEGLDPRLARAVLVHGLDSLTSDVYFPRSWEERIVMVADKMVEASSFAGIETRLAALRARYPQAEELVRLSGPILAEMQASLADAAGVPVDDFVSGVANCLEVSIFPASAGPADVEAVVVVR